MKTVVIPAPKLERLNEFDAAVCPDCGVWLVLKDLKDGVEFQFSGIEYQKHYKAVHLRKKK